MGTSPDRGRSPDKEGSPDKGGSPYKWSPSRPDRGTPLKTYPGTAEYHAELILRLQAAEAERDDMKKKLEQLR